MLRTFPDKWNILGRSKRGSENGSQIFGAINAGLRNRGIISEKRGPENIS